MSFQKELNDSYASLDCNKITERKKASEKLIDLLNNERVIALINEEDPFSWQMLLEASQNCLRKECNKYAENVAKKGTSKVADKNFVVSKDLFVLVVNTSMREGEENIRISKLIKYIHGCLQEKKMRICKNDFISLLKENVLQNINCLGLLEPEDFIVLFELLTSELGNCSTSKLDDLIVINCLMLLIKYGPLSALPPSFLREKFSFISKLCQSVNRNDPRPQQEDIVAIVLQFCKHTAEDNRVSCSKLGEEVFSTMLDLYLYSGHESVLKVNFIEFCLLQMTIHNPNGASQGDSQAYAPNWHNWKMCIKKMYSVLTQEISQYLRQYVKNTLFFVPQGKSTVILDSFLSLFVEVCKQLFKETESPMNYSLMDSFDIATQSQKRRKVDASLDSLITEIKETKSWVWIKLTGALLTKYPLLVDENIFLNLLQTLHTLQLEVKDNYTVSYIYECQAILTEVECYVNITNKSDVVNLWRLIGDSTLRAVGLNQNIKETQNLLQKLIDRNFINLEAVIQTYTSGVLIITEHHLHTLGLVLEHIDFSQLKATKREEIFNSLLNSQNVKDYTCFLKQNFAENLISLMLKQCPIITKINIEKPPDPYESICDIYSKSNFDPKHLMKNEEERNPNEHHKRTYNVDYKMVKTLTEKIKSFVEGSHSESIERSLCIVGLLYNILNCMVDYQIIDTSQIEQCSISLMIKNILVDERLVAFLKNSENHSEKRLKELLHITELLKNIFSLRNSVTDFVKELFTLDFFLVLFEVLNFFQNAAKNKAHLEHQIKKSITEALSKYCLISNRNEINRCQRNILLVLAKPDYDYSNETDYDLIMTFLKSIKFANTGALAEDATEKILDCLRGLCSARYRSYLSALDILHVLTGLYMHLDKIENETHKSLAVTLLNPFYLRITYYGPQVSLAILDCIEQLCKVDHDCKYSNWDGKEVITYVPEFLASDYQKVRYRAIEVLVQFIKISSETTKPKNIQRLKQLFSSIYQMNVKVFEVEGALTDDRRLDEVVFRASSALYTFVSIMINCTNWTQESLFAIIKLEHSKKLFSILDGELLEKAFHTLQTKFGSRDFMNKYLENILIEWINLRYDMNDFQFNFFDCKNKTEFYIKYFDICLPLLLRQDRNSLFDAAKHLKMNEKDALERCCTKIFGRALCNDIKNVSNDFLQKNVEVSYVSQVLGSRLKEILIENIDQLLLSLLNNVADVIAFQNNLNETIVFTNGGISFKDFNICLKFIENYLCNGQTLMDFFNATRLNKLQKILLELQVKIYMVLANDRFKCFHQYTLFVNHLRNNTESNSKFIAFLIRDTVYFLIHMAKNNLQYPKLCRAILKYLDSFLRSILPNNSKYFEEFLIFTVNSIKNIAIENEFVFPICLNILNFLVIDNANSLADTIEKLDTFPQNSEFEPIKKVHNNIKYSKKPICLKGEIKSFLANNDMAARQDSLVHLKNILSKEKKQLKCMYESLDNIRGFSEDCEKSILHQLTSSLVKMSCYPNESVSYEAIKCLGELGPANLTTLVLEPEKKVLNIKCSSFELLTGHVVSLLTKYIVDPDINVIKHASDALYVILNFKEGKKVVDSGLDFGYGVINISLMIPFIENSQKLSSHVKVNLEQFSDLINDSALWCPSDPIDNNQWIKLLVLALINSFDNGCYLKDLVSVCNVKVKFCEQILPLLIYLMVSLNSKIITDTLSKQINYFFWSHWNVTVTSATDKTLIAVNKKSVKCMLDVVNFVRQQFNFLNKPFGLTLNYVLISKAAEFCSAHFSALLYAEIWCQEKIADIEQSTPRDGTPFENGYTLLDFIYENVSEEIGTTLQNNLQSAYKAIGDLDALSGCGISFLLRPERRVEHYKNIGQWDNVFQYYSMQPINNSDSSRTNLIDSLKMNHLYQLPLLCNDLLDEPQYECLWRLGQWNTNRKDHFKSNEVDSKIYDKYHFYSLKSLCDNDLYTLGESKKQLSRCVTDDLKHTSLESSKNLYPILTKLQSLVEMDDWEMAIERNSFEEILNKWKMQDEIIRKNDFQFVEPISAQRITILGEHTKKYPNFRKAFFDMVLNFADYAKGECQIRVAENAIINIRKISELEPEVKNELQFREAQLAWLNNDKIIAQQLLRKLCNSEEISRRLKANALKLQGEYMAEMYSNKTNILNSFYGSIKLLNDMIDQLTIEDYKNLEDTYDKIASFADREYQQIMNHIKSDLFQKKVSNMKSCKEMMKSLNDQKRKSDDERRAALLHERQSRIDENEIKTTREDKDFVLCLALKYYMKNLSKCDANNIKIFRIISLFLENRDNQKIEGITKLLPDIPSYKYIIMLPQLIPHICENAPDFFSSQINKIIEKCAVDHPHHTLPLLLALVNANKDREYSKSKTKVTLNDRSLTAVSMIEKLKKKKELSEIIIRMQKLSEALIELAYFVSNSNNSRKNEFDIPSSLKIRRIQDFDNILVPTYTLPVSKRNEYKNIIGITKFKSTYKTVGGITAPKRIECHSTLGTRLPQLVKGQDDLRQDAVMEQVFTIMTNLLSSSTQTKNLIIRTYKIVPLSMRSGILEWVANSMPIGDYLAGSKEEEYIGAHRQFRPQDKTPNDCRIKFKNCAGKSLEEKLQTYNAICRDLKPVFHKFFESHFPQPSVWYERKRAYIHSVATTSMCGYVLGIGDRHVSNILVDKQTAEVIHIDFGIAFEQGKCLPTPETVPFRLSRDIVDGMGVSGIEGLFRKSCEKTMQVLRANSKTILTILEVLLYDPLYFWTLSSAEANKRQTDEEIYGGVADDSEEENKNISAERALLRLRGKLEGSEDGKQSSVEQQVGNLIQQAMNPANLCRLYQGWQPYL